MNAEDLTASLASPDALPHGWLNHIDELLRLVEARRPMVYVELGTWLGASAIAVARSVRRWGGTVYCVDTWTGDAVARDLTPWQIVTCARNMRDAGVASSIRLICSTTQDAAASWWEPPIDLLYIDADHSFEGALNDLTGWIAKMRSGGVMVGDDYDNPLFPGVRQAWDLFERESGIALTRYQSDPPHPTGIQLVYGTV